MTKGLEAFENIMKVYGDTNSLEGTYDDFLTIKRALKRLEQIDNTEPSEALKCLEYIGELCYVEAGDAEEDCVLYAKNYIGFDTIKNYILKAQEQENTRYFGKELINLNNSLKQSIDKPILYVSRYGNKYIVSQKLFENQEKVLNIIKEKDVNFEVFGAFETYKDYEIYYNNKFHLIENKLTEEEFDTLKGWIDNELSNDES